MLCLCVAVVAMSAVCSLLPAALCCIKFSASKGLDRPADASVSQHNTENVLSDSADAVGMALCEAVQPANSVT